MIKQTMLGATFYLLLSTLAACKDTSPTTPNVNNTGIGLTNAFPALTFSEPVGLYQSTAGQWFLIEQSGIIYTFSKIGENKREFLNIEDRVRSGGERGLLGMALDPNFGTNGYFYVSYTSEDNNSVISLFSSQQVSSKNTSSQNYSADVNSEKILLSIPQPYSNHNGGQISFGPDGYLYIGLGDGGSGGDPKQNGQNTNSLLGAMLRINVSANDGTYTIPNTNPFVNKTGKNEIYAYGLRNPWRWSFDKKTGELWLADVGQNQWEEVNIIENGGNYGWNIMEANHCYNNDSCNEANLVKPVYEYSHNEGYSITGGYVYRGSKIDILRGHYLYADYVTKKIWALFKKENGGIENKLLVNSPINISSFAEDNEGNLFVIGHQSGKIYKLIAQ